MDRIQKRTIGDNRSLITTADVENGVKEGCRQIARRIMSEYATRMPYIESIINHFTDGFNAYRYVEIKSRLAEAMKHSSSIGKMARKVTVEELLDDLYEIGFFGKFTKPDTTNAIDTKPIQPVDNRRYALFSFRTPSLNLLENEVVIIHPIYWSTLNLQERRTEFDIRGIVEPTDVG